jgi:hypothetical protein
MRAWHICPKWRMALGAAAKCGSTMLAKFVEANGAHRLPVKDARYGRECWTRIPSSYRAVMVVRHPVDRFMSLYANVQERKRQDQNFYKQLEGLSPSAFLDKLVKVSPDLMADFHFQQQTTIEPPNRDVEHVRLEHFDRWVAQNLPYAVRPRPANESTGGYPVSEELVQRVIAYYLDDFALWEKAHVVPGQVVSAEG